MPTETKELVLGGQAVIEGVMMKGPLLYAVAVRKASGEIRVRDFPLVESASRKRIAKIPLVRGVVTMAVMLAIGYRALQYSADEAMADEWARVPAYVTSADAVLGPGGLDRLLADFRASMSEMQADGRVLFSRWVDLWA